MGSLLDIAEPCQRSICMWFVGADGVLQYPPTSGLGSRLWWIRWRLVWLDKDLLHELLQSVSGAVV